MTTSYSREDRKNQRELVNGRWTATYIPDDRHGNLNSYTNLMCRCERCTKANREWQSEQRRRRHDQRVLIGGRLTALGAPVHNSSTYSNWGCRCEVCTDEWALKKRGQ